MKERGTRCQCIRCREVKGKSVRSANLRLDDQIYQSGICRRAFHLLHHPEDGLAGFIRLSLPKAGSPETGMSELDGAALIREVHVYGQSLEVGSEKTGAAQHAGLGTRLLEEAENWQKKTATKNCRHRGRWNTQLLSWIAALNAANIIW
jgi:elongator complex protein 3